MRRIWNLPAEVVQRRGGSVVLDIAAAEAVHTTDIASRGFTCVAVEPSPTMVAAALKRIAAANAPVSLVRGFAESLPFRDASFDQVLCHSAIDHFAEPDRCIREMARVLRPSGSLILTFVNYAGVSTRVSRALYGCADRLRPRTRMKPWFWESPVGNEHSFECTLPVLREMCEQYLTLEEVFGVSIGWQVPGWGRLLERLGPRLSEAILGSLDGVARRLPSAADVVVVVWRPKPRRAWQPRLPSFQMAPAAQDEIDVSRADSLRVTGADPVYRRLIRADVEPRTGWVDLPQFVPVLEGYWRMTNRQVTGDPERSWMSDLIERRNEGRAAVLGLNGSAELLEWQRSRRGQPTDVFDLCPSVIEEARRSLAANDLAHDVDFFLADLNFLRLPRRRYDVIWSSGCLHHVVNLEHLLDRIAEALTPDGFFSVYDYIGERRRQFDPRRLAAMNALFRDIPSRFRRGESDRLESQDPEQLRPFCAVRSDEIRDLLQHRFEVVHEVTAGHFHPLELYLDVQRIEAEEPSLIDRLLEAEVAARRDPLHTACTLYGVYRRKGEFRG